MKNATASQVAVLGSSAEDLVSGGVFEFGPGETIFEGEKHSVYVSAFFIRKNPVCFTEWDLVTKWAAAHDYEFLNEENASSERHPVRNINWYDALKWCNAKSEMEGLLPCYRVAGMIYRKGEEDGVACDWNARGYRLPTKAEWEKAASGSHLLGVRVNNRPFGERFYEWCWDRVNPRYKQGVYDPKGPDKGEHRVLRGGLNVYSSGHRYHGDSASPPEHIEGEYGFRVVRSSERTPLVLAFSKRIPFVFRELIKPTALVIAALLNALVNLWPSANAGYTIKNLKKVRGERPKRKRDAQPTRFLP